MSDYVYKYIPVDLNDKFEVSIKAVEAFLKSYGCSFDQVQKKDFENIQFIDCGTRFEMVVCNHCQHNVLSIWGQRMNESSKSGFVNRKLITPCCGKESDLKDLIYYGDAGFATSVIEVINPSADIESIDMFTFEKILGKSYKCIIAAY